MSMQHACCSLSTSQCKWQSCMLEICSSNFSLCPSRASFKLGCRSSGICILNVGLTPKPRIGRHVTVCAQDENSSPKNVESAVQATVEQSKKILALQKELLQQIAERKKLIASLKANIGNTAKQIKSYNEDDTSRVDNMGQASATVRTPDNRSSLEDESESKTVKSSKVAEPCKDHLALAASPPTSSGRLQNPESLISESETIKIQSKSLHPEVPPTSSYPESSSLAPYSLPESHRKKQIPTVTGRKSILTIEGVNKDDNRAGAADKIGDTAADKVGDETPLAGPNVMNIICVAAECAPWSKTGGLGDVVAALPKALAARGHRVMVVIPRYGNYEEAWKIGTRKTYNVAGQDMEVGYYHAYIHGVDYVFIDNPIFHGFSNNIYGGSREDILKRMILLCKAAVEVQWHVPCGGACYGDGNLVFIANDWHTALVPVYLQAYYRENGMMTYARAVLVIHNIAHQGRGPLREFGYLGLPDHYIQKFRLYDPVGGEHMNVFMAGLITAHRIVAVSHGYAWECQTKEGGWGLDGVIREHGWKLNGIVNGIDDKEWSPERDIFLQSDGYSNYGVGTHESGKAKCKAALQKELGLPVQSDVPVLGFIGRLDNQKGVDIIADSMHWLMGQDLQLILLGSGRADLESMLRSFESQHRNKVRGWVGFSVQTAHRITAGADILLMPSRFEPCGLNQLYAMRYGTVPVVHAVGGLRDTVQNFDPYANTGTGWTFNRAEPSAMIDALGNALWTYREFKDSWLAIQKRGMTQDLSWENAAKKYEDVLISAKYQW